MGETDKKTYELLKSLKTAYFLLMKHTAFLMRKDIQSITIRREALEQIIAFMDVPENRRTCCLIFAGYEKDMQGLYKSNSGMRSRIEGGFISGIILQKKPMKYSNCSVQRMVLNLQKVYMIFMFQFLKSLRNLNTFQTVEQQEQYLKNDGKS